MNRWAAASLALAAACSSLDEGEAGIVSLQITTPEVLTVEVGQQVQLSAVALDADGIPVDVPVTWRAADPTITVGETTGLVTGVSPGSGRVQAIAGPLASDLLAFTILGRPDTLLLASDSVVTLEPGATASGPLVVSLQMLNPPAPVANRPVTYQITAPPSEPTLVTLSGGGQTATPITGTDGTVGSVQLLLNPGVTPPDTAIVQVSAARSDGTPVPGSGQRFLILFP